MEKVEWKVEGMDCTNCALTISRYLNKEGLKNVQVNFIGGDVSFETNGDVPKEKLAKGIEDLGYHVSGTSKTGTGTHQHHHGKGLFSNHLQRFLFCLPFTLVLMLHMFPLHHIAFIHALMNPWVQLAICLPVYVVGMGYFGVSAVKSLSRGVPNMNVLIALGATAAFIYSLIGTIAFTGMDYIFYETTATIITLVFLGEWIEHKSVDITQRELQKLSKQQKVMANMIAFDDQHKENIFPVENTQLHVGDLILIRSGEQVPADCKILWGEAYVNEALLTGESKPVFKQKKNILTGGSVFTDGTVKAQVTAAGDDTVLSNIINMVKQAQTEKPPVQQLADKISAIFVPAVISIAAITFLLNYFAFNIPATASLMRSIAVLVISCPCAMGLATPAAIAVGLGRAAKNGILFRNAKSLELFKNISTVIFDKTGTLTKGNLSLTKFESLIEEPEFKRICYSIEKFSNHPVARSVISAWATNNLLQWKKIEEIKGSGMHAEDMQGNRYKLISYKAARESGLTVDNGHTAYLVKNNEAIGWFDAEDEIRTEAVAVIKYLHNKNIKTILLSGDSAEKANNIAKQLGIDEVYAEKSPEEKLKIVERLNNETPVAMVGDGINDSPALAKATIGISMSEASQLAVQSAQVVLMNSGIQKLPLALGLGKNTFLTIKQNLFWAFIYNVVAIPVAAMGFLQPGFAALAMGFSDVVLAINSIRLKYRKVV
ncbi:MAG: cation-translocating P-type ATPase [Ferruginibacter sp.]